MESYKNLSGVSSVSAYEIDDTSIKIKFKTTSKIYLYSYIKPGQKHVDKMKELAIAGRGLQTYINKHKSAGYDRTPF